MACRAGSAAAEPCRPACGHGRAERPGKRTASAGSAEPPRRPGGRVNCELADLYAKQRAVGANVLQEARSPQLHRKKSSEKHTKWSANRWPSTKKRQRVLEQVTELRRFAMKTSKNVQRTRKKFSRKNSSRSLPRHMGIVRGTRAHAPGHTRSDRERRRKRIAGGWQRLGHSSGGAATGARARAARPGNG